MSCSSSETNLGARQSLHLYLDRASGAKELHLWILPLPGQASENTERENLVPTKAPPKPWPEVL